MRTMLPADTYILFNKSFLTPQGKDVLVSLYQPIIGLTAVSLYLTLYNDLPNNEVESSSLTHHHLMSMMMTDLKVILEARKKLEAIGLLKTFYKEDNINNYIYILYAPLSAQDFLNHPILNVVLYNNVGKVEYENIVSKYKTKKINIKDYKDITTSFDEIYTSVNGYSIDNSDIIEEKVRKLEINSNIDLNLIISGIPKYMVNSRCFNKESMDLIIYLSYLYKIDNLNMQGLVRNSINEKGMIDSMELRKLCRNFYQFENNGKLPTLIYNTQPDHLREPEGDKSDLAKLIYTFENVSPIIFLKSQYNGAEPTDYDKRLIENLMVNQKLMPGVINVLIDYVLKTNNMKLNKNLIETIAGHWKRKNIETVKEAINECRKEHKKIKKQLPQVTKSSKKIEIEGPDWLNKKIEVNNDNNEELEALLKDFE